MHLPTQLALSCSRVLHLSKQMSDCPWVSSLFLSLVFFTGPYLLPLPPPIPTQRPVSIISAMEVESMDNSPLIS